MLKDPTDKRGHTNCFNKSNNFVTDEMKYVTKYVSVESGCESERWPEYYRPKSSGK